MLSFPSTKRKSTADSNTLSSSNVVDVLSSASTELQEDDGSFLLREGEQGAIIPFDNALLGTNGDAWGSFAQDLVNKLGSASTKNLGTHDDLLHVIETECVPRIKREKPATVALLFGIWNAFVAFVVLQAPVIFSTSSTVPNHLVPAWSWRSRSFEPAFFEVITIQIHEVVYELNAAGFAFVFMLVESPSLAAAFGRLLSSSVGEFRLTVDDIMSCIDMNSDESAHGGVYAYSPDVVSSGSRSKFKPERIYLGMSQQILGRWKQHRDREGVNHKIRALHVDPSIAHFDKWFAKSIYLPLFAASTPLLYFWEFCLNVGFRATDSVFGLNCNVLDWMSGQQIVSAFGVLVVWTKLLDYVSEVKGGVRVVERRQCLTYADLPLADQLVEICGLKPSSIINIIYGKAWRSFTATFPASFQFPAAAFSGGFLPVNLTPDRVPLPLALHEMGNLRASGSRGAANKVAKVDDSPAELNEKGQSFVNKFRPNFVAKSKKPRGEQ